MKNTLTYEKIPRHHAQREFRKAFNKAKKCKKLGKEKENEKEVEERIRKKKVRDIITEMGDSSFRNLIL